LTSSDFHGKLTAPKTAHTSLWAQKVDKEKPNLSECRMPSPKAVKLSIYLIAHCQGFILHMKGTISKGGLSLAVFSRQV